MLNATGKTGRFVAGSVVYLRCKVVGFDDAVDTKGIPRVALQPVSKTGEPEADHWLYSDEDVLIDGRLVVAEIAERTA